MYRLHYMRCIYLLFYLKIKIVYEPKLKKYIFRVYKLEAYAKQKELATIAAIVLTEWKTTSICLTNTKCKKCLFSQDSFLCCRTCAHVAKAHVAVSLFWNAEFDK